MVFVLIALAAVINLVFYRKKINLNTGFMAVVMTLGIINFGVLHLSVNHSFITIVFYYVTFIIWVTFWMNILAALSNHSFAERHIRSEINRFTIGTWIAGTSIFIVLTYINGIAGHGWLDVLALLNVVLWLSYLGMSFHTIRIGLRKWKHTILSGNLFLTTVSTQSVAIMLRTVFPGLNVSLIFIIISLRLIFYMISFILIISHFSIRHWNATNCIFHGALSITGVALLYNDIIPDVHALAFWSVVLAVFMIVEMMELIILFTKLKKHHFKEVLFKSNISHWSRLFTFGMFYTFTSMLEIKQGIVESVKNGFLSFLFITIFLLLLIELVSLGISLYRKASKPEAGRMPAG